LLPQGRYGAAEPLLFDIGEKTLGLEHPDTARFPNNPTEAEALLKRALGIREIALGSEHPDVAQSLSNLAVLYWITYRYAEALEHVRRATVILRGRAIQGSTERSAGGQTEQVKRQELFRTHVAISAGAAIAQPHQRTQLVTESFEVAQLARSTTVAAAVTGMAARFAAGDNALTVAVREQQDLLARWRDRDTSLVEALSRAPDQRDWDLEARLRTELTEIDRRLNELDARLELEFPVYAALTAPTPLAVDRAQELLRPGEALVSFLVDDDATYAWVVRAGAAELRELQVGREVLTEQVGRLRAGPEAEIEERRDRDQGRFRDGSSVVEGFDVDLARELYEQLWAPLEPLLAGAAHVILVPDGPLDGLPFHVLVTEKPAQELEHRDDLRRVAWLARTHAISVLPSVGSLRALRELAAGVKATKAFIGFGDPNIGSRISNLAVAPQSLGAVWRLHALPDTEQELYSLASFAGVDRDSVFLRERATEQSVRRMNLSDYRVIAFATHALQAGELEGLAEPALVLTPTGPSETDDGLLLASEIAQLDLDAELVILSAGNTAAKDGRPGAEGLSGLARAFFYAGARALLVSHLGLNSDAAVRLTTGALGRLHEEPGLGRAEALRRTMVDLIESGPDPHPAYWAPFVVVGEGYGRIPSLPR
jgi:CHAT domain-containing protein